MSLLKKKIINVRKDIRKKLLAMKLNRAERDQEFEETYKPILEPLHKIASEANRLIKQEQILPKVENTETYSDAKENALSLKRNWHDVTVDEFPQYPDHMPRKKSRTFSTDLTFSHVPDYMQTNEDGEEDNEKNLLGFKSSNKQNDTFKSLGNDATDDDATLDQGTRESLQQFHKIPRGYIADYFKDLMTSKNPKKSTIFDRNLGLVYNPESQNWSIGKDTVTLNGPNLIIGDLEYKGTPGLYELLFKRKPIGATEHDKWTYVDILKRSHAIYRHNSDSNQIQGLRSAKYTEIIKPRLQHVSAKSRANQLLNEMKKRRSSWNGEGFDVSLKVEKRPYRAIYWDDPNELVERLWLLHASKEAGNNSHDNEIVAIEEELREANIII